MREMIQMVVVLVLLSVVSGGLLAAIKTGTEAQIESQKIKFDKAPAIREIFSRASDNPVDARFVLQDGDMDRLFFPATIEGNPDFVAIEGFGQGFGGAIGLMVGFDFARNVIVGARVTSHTETPGIGSKLKDDPSFVRRFEGMHVQDLYQLKGDGGDIDAVSGATVSSAGVCTAMTEASRIFKRMKPQIIENLNTSSN